MVDAATTESSHHIHIHSVFRLLEASHFRYISLKSIPFSIHTLPRNPSFDFQSTNQPTDKMKFSISIAATIAAFVAPIAAGPAAAAPAGFNLNKRATFPIPASKGSVTYKAPYVVSGTFDGGMKTYGRGVKCTGQDEGGDSDAVFTVKSGGTLKNAIIGKDQIEGVHCEGPCTIENVWWVDVCEDALSIKGDGNAMVKGGGAQSAADKVVQHNGKGTVTIDGFSKSPQSIFSTIC